MSLTNMPLKSFKTKEEIPEGQREGALALVDGTFAVMEEVDNSAEITELKRKHEAAEKLAKKAAAELLAFNASKAGVTGEELAKIRAEVRTEVLGELQPVIDSGKLALSENRTLKLDNKVKGLAAESGVRADRLAQWWKLHNDKFDLTEDGTPIVKNQPGVTINKFILGACKEESPEFYNGSQGTGGGASGTSNARTGTVSTVPADVLANPSASLAAARAAGKTE